MKKSYRSCKAVAVTAKNAVEIRCTGEDAAYISRALVQFLQKENRHRRFYGGSVVAYEVQAE